MDLVCANCRITTLSAQIQRRRGPCAVPCYFWSVLVTRNWCVSGRAEAGGPTYNTETMNSCVLHIQPTHHSWPYHLIHAFVTHSLLIMCWIIATEIIFRP